MVATPQLLWARRGVTIISPGNFKTADFSSRAGKLMGIFLWRCMGKGDQDAPEPAL